MLLNLNELVEKYKMNIKGVLHIGAHFGNEMSTYENLKIENVTFFEPVPKTFEVLKNNVGSKATLFNVALGSFEGESEMFVESANSGQSSSILEPMLHLSQYPNIVFNEKIKTKVTKLDNYIETSDLHNFINMDVQGYELEVLKGSVMYLEKIDYIMTEVNNKELYKNCALVEEIDEFLSRFNFVRVETYWAGGTWGDALYIKNKI